MLNNARSGDGLKSGFSAFWQSKGESCVKIVQTMTARDSWNFDDEEKVLIDELLGDINKYGISSRLNEIDELTLFTVMGWLSSEKSLALLSQFENVSQGHTEKLLNPDNLRFGRAFKIFVERLHVFSAAKLTSELFSLERIERIDRSVRGALRLC